MRKYPYISFLCFIIYVGFHWTIKISLRLIVDIAPLFYIALTGSE